MMMTSVSLLLVLVFASLQPISGDHSDVFSSTADLTRLLQLETRFITDLSHLADTLASEAAAIRQYLETHYPDGSPSESRGEEWVSHPINSLYLIKRLGLELTRANIPSILGNNNTETLRRSLNTSLASLPTKEDWEGAANGVFLLQEHYNLNITQLSAGTVQYGGVQIESSHQLAGEELHQIGVAAVNRGYLDTGLEWLQLARARLTLEGAVPFLTRGFNELDEYIQTTKKIHDHYLDKSGVVGVGHRCNRLPFDSKLRKKKKYRAAKKEGLQRRAEKDKKLVPLFKEFQTFDTFEKFKPYKAEDMRDNFEDVCMGETHRTPDMDIGQACRHLHHRDPFSRLGPFLYEQLSSQPLITLIHQLMTDQEMEHFKNYARDNLVRSGTGGQVTSLKRTSKQTWLEYRSFTINLTEVVAKVEGVTTEQEAAHITNQPDGWNHYFMTKDVLNTTDSVAKRVSDRMSRATTFQLWNPYTSESFQVANYGLGGQYQTHSDPHGYWEGKRGAQHLFELTGDRLATIMVYLENVAAGGATAFPNTGIRVPVSKGDAAFWINMRTSGTLDRLTHHGGCPVLVGSKWITNKWVGYKEQWHAWPCARGDPMARYQPFHANHYY